jgi:hypothetical protein
MVAQASRLCRRRQKPVSAKIALWTQLGIKSLNLRWAWLSLPTVEQWRKIHPVEKHFQTGVKVT